MIHPWRENITAVLQARKSLKTGKTGAETKQVCQGALGVQKLPDVVHFSVFVRDHVVLRYRRSRVARPREDARVLHAAEHSWRCASWSHREGGESQARDEPPPLGRGQCSAWSSCS